MVALRLAEEPLEEVLVVVVENGANAYSVVIQAGGMLPYACTAVAMLIKGCRLVRAVMRESLYWVAKLKETLDWWVDAEATNKWAERGTTATETMRFRSIAQPMCMWLCMNARTQL